AEPRILISGPEESNVRLGLKPPPPLLWPPPPPLLLCCGLRPPLRERFIESLCLLNTVSALPAWALLARRRRVLFAYESPARPHVPVSHLADPIFLRRKGNLPIPSAVKIIAAPPLSKPYFG